MVYSRPMIYLCGVFLVCLHDSQLSPMACTAMHDGADNPALCFCIYAMITGKHVCWFQFSARFQILVAYPITFPTWHHTVLCSFYAFCHWFLTIPLHFYYQLETPRMFTPPWMHKQHCPSHIKLWQADMLCLNLWLSFQHFHLQALGQRILVSRIMLRVLVTTT